MKLSPKHLRLYAVTDRTWLHGQSLLHVVELAIKSGVTMIQLREKDLGPEAFLKEALAMKKITSHYNVPLIINDNIDIALLCDADGVHIGQEDGTIEEARIRLGKDKIIGVTAKTIDQALVAQKAGADYLGSGAVFGSTTKTNAKYLSLDSLQAICEATTLPVVAIGGIDEGNVTKLKQTGIKGIAVVSGIFAQPDIAKATLNLNTLLDEVIVP